MEHYFRQFPNFQAQTQKNPPHVLPCIGHGTARPVLIAKYQTDMAVFHTENPQYSAGLLTFVMEYLLANKWPKNGLMSDYNECDEACDQGQTEPCGCTCTTDPFDWEDDEVSKQTVVKSLVHDNAHAGVLGRLEKVRETTPDS